MARRTSGPIVLACSLGGRPSVPPRANRHGEFRRDSGQGVYPSTVSAPGASMAPGDALRIRWIAGRSSLDPATLIALLFWTADGYMTLSDAPRGS